MLRIFKKTSELDKLRSKYAKLQHQAYTLSKTNRSESDKKQAEAHEIGIRIAELSNQ